MGSAPSSSNSSVQSQMNSTNSDSNQSEGSQDSTNRSSSSVDMEQEDGSNRHTQSNDHEQHGNIILSGQNAVTVLTKLLSVFPRCREGPLPATTLQSLPRVLVMVVKDCAKPATTLWATKAIAYLCYALPESAGLLVSYGVVPALCPRLHAIDNQEVAEQCIRALDNTSTSCLFTGWGYHGYSKFYWFLLNKHTKSSYYYLGKDILCIISDASFGEPHPFSLDGGCSNIMQSSSV